MAIVNTLSMYNFMDGMQDRGFSYEALKYMYDYYDEMSEDIGEPIEFDPVAFCGEWSEYNMLDDLITDYSNVLERDGIDHINIEDEEERESAVIDAMQKHTIVAVLNDCYLVQCF